LESKWPVGKAQRVRIPKWVCKRAATPPPGYFHSNPKGGMLLGVFPRCSLGKDPSEYSRFARALKNAQNHCRNM